jgi:hypothetical protein
MRNRKPHRIRPRAPGFTLAELIVAGAIGSLAILVLVGVLRKGIEISETSQHRQRARAIIDSCLESPTYQCNNFVNIAAPPAATGVIIDPRSAGAADDLTGALAITVTPGVNTTPVISSGVAARDNVAFKRIAMKVSWLEPEGRDSVLIEKSVTNLDF